MAGIETKMMGVGCFAGQQTLVRVLGRLMEAYSLGDWTEVVPKAEGASAACHALRKLIPGALTTAGQEGTGSGDEKITGFFLAFEDCRLSLSVFLRRQGMRSRKYTASLDALTRLRQSRLH
jgi:hypothetical protein